MWHSGEISRDVRELYVGDYKSLPASGVEDALLSVQEHIVEESARLRPKDGRDNGTPEPILAAEGRGLVNL